MKRTFIAALAFLALASCGEKKTAENTTENEVAIENPVEETTKENVTPEGDYVFVDVAYVISESDIVKNEGKALEEKGKKLEDKFAKNEQSLQYQMKQLNEKAQKGLITSRDYNAEGEKLQKNMAYLQQQAQKEGAEFQEEMMVFNNRVQDIIRRAVQQINADKKYKMVINLNNALIDFDSSLDITSAVLAKVNELYKSEPKSTTSDKKKKK
jgi:outer membrane protein